MKIIKTIAGLTLGALIACTTVAAQESKERKKGDRPEGKGPPTIEQQLEKMTKELSLTDEQKPKVKAVIVLVTESFLIADDIVDETRSC